MDETAAQTNGRVPKATATEWLARVVVTPKSGVNDPEGEAIRGGLAALGYDGVGRVRAGRYFEVTLSGTDPDAASATVGEMCERLLANPVIESYRVTVDEQPTAAAVTLEDR